MTAKEIREAAEFVKSIPQITDFDGEAHKLADYILANVQEDGEEAVTEDWLREEWGFTDDLGDMVLVVPKWEAIFWVPELSRIEFGMTWARISTSSQFRSLMAGLGIEPKKISQKNIITS